MERKAVPNDTMQIGAMHGKVSCMVIRRTELRQGVLVSMIFGICTSCMVHMLAWAFGYDMGCSKVKIVTFQFSLFIFVLPVWCVVSFKRARVHYASIIISFC